MNTTGANLDARRFTRELLSDFPRPDHAAAEAIRHWSKGFGKGLDPERILAVVLHYQPDSQGSLAVVSKRMTLTQAVLANWQDEPRNLLTDFLFQHRFSDDLPTFPITLVDHLGSGPNQGDGYLVYNGLFRVTHPQRYDEQTRVKLPAEKFQRFIWQLDFNSTFKGMLDQYWSRRLEQHAQAVRISFIAACNKQVAEGSLSDAARQLAWRVAGLADAGAVRTRLLNIYGYVATDLLCANDIDSGQTLLYIPGNSSPLHGFDSEQQMQQWVAQQCKDGATRQALAAHFAAADLPDGLEFSGLATALQGLAVYPQRNDLPKNRPGFTAEGVWTPSVYVNYKADKYSPPLTGDVFKALTLQQQRRSYADADFVITSNGEVNKERWRGYLNTSMNLLAPLVMVLPVLAPLYALGGIAQFGLGLDQAINGKDLQDKSAGIDTATYGLLNATPLLLEAAGRVGALFRPRLRGFVMPSRINQQLGYPLSPVSPPRLPEQALGAFFETSEPVAALPAANQDVAMAVQRIPLGVNAPDMLEASIDEAAVEVHYDLQADAFLPESELNEVEPSHYQASEQNLELEPVRPGRVVNDQTRMSTLRALGVNLRLPVTLPDITAATLQPIPRQIMGLWVGDKLIGDNLLEIIAANAKVLETSDYRYRLFLSSENPSSYAQNLQRLNTAAPRLEVLPLEQQAFFIKFRQSANFAQYQAAVDGNGGVATNFSSASDVLRYPMLEHEGGLYMDVDDALLPAGEQLRGADGQPAGPANPGIDSVPLATTAEGLLLHRPMSNNALGMRNQYNTSMIGSHAGNPTLRAVSEEMHLRYQAQPEFYLHRPDALADPQGFAQYTQDLNRLTGPGLLNDVIDRTLPALSQLREIDNLFSIRVLNLEQFIDIDRLETVLEQLQPLSRIARVGAEHSWLTT